MQANCIARTDKTEDLAKIVEQKWNGWYVDYLKVKWYATRKRWRLIIPARFTDDGKKQFKLFPTKQEGDSEIRRILHRAGSSKPQVTEADEGALTLQRLRV